MRVHITGNHQYRIVGRVPGVVIVLQRLGGGFIKGVTGTQRRMFVWGAFIEVLAQLCQSLEYRAGHVAGYFLLNGATFVFPLFGLHIHRAHANGMNTQCHIQILLGHGEVVPGGVFAGFGVEIATHVGGQGRDLVFTQPWTAAEHHVLYSVSGTGKACRHVVTTGAVVHLGGDHWRQFVFNNYHPQAIFQCGAGDILIMGLGTAHGTQGQRDGAGQRCQLLHLSILLLLKRSPRGEAILKVGAVHMQLRLFVIHLWRPQ